MASYEKEQLRIQKFWDDLLAAEAAEQEEQIDESEGSDNDEVEEHSEDSDSEQSTEEIIRLSDLSPQPARPLVPVRVPYCYGKDNLTKWYRHFDGVSRKKKQQNILREVSGPTDQTKNLTSVEEIWQAFFTDEMLDQVVTYTNIYI